MTKFNIGDIVRWDYKSVGTSKDEVKAEEFLKSRDEFTVHYTYADDTVEILEYEEGFTFSQDLFSLVDYKIGETYVFSSFLKEIRDTSYINDKSNHLVLVGYIAGEDYTFHSATRESVENYKSGKGRFYNISHKFMVPVPKYLPYEKLKMEWAREERIIVNNYDGKRYTVKGIVYDSVDKEENLLVEGNHNSNIICKDLVNAWSWEDGTPCGELVK